MQTKNINLNQEQQKNNYDSEKHLDTQYTPIGSTYYGTVAATPPYRMPPGAEALPGAPAPLHTHSAKFPIEREVILSPADKAPRPPQQEPRRRGRLGAVAPDVPPKAVMAWHESQAGPSAEYRQYDPNYGYAGQGAIPRHYEQAPKPPIPSKNLTVYQKPEQNQSITVTIETAKDITKDAPKSTKSVSKTYHTIKDMISNRFKKEQVEEKDTLNNEEKREEQREEKREERDVRKMEQGIYGRPMQVRPETQFPHGVPNNMAYPSPSMQSRQQMIQHHMVQQQIMLQQAQQARSQEMLAQQARSQEMLAQQARSQEMLAHQARSQEMLAQRPMALGADALYQQYGHAGRRSAVYQKDLDVRSMANFTSLKQTGMPENFHSRPDLRSPQQLEREIVRHQGLVVGRRASSHPHLLDEPPSRPEPSTSHDRSRRNSYGNLLDDQTDREDRPKPFEEKIRSSGRSTSSRVDMQEYRRTPDSHKEARTPDPSNHRVKESSVDNRDEVASHKSADSVYNSGKAEGYGQASSRQTPSRIEDLKAHGKKGDRGSGGSSDYDKNGGQSSNVDSGRGSVAYSSGRRPEPEAVADPGPSQAAGQAPDPEWADIVECELRQILQPQLAGLRLDSGSSVTSVTPPLPPLSPSEELHKRSSLPARGSEYEERRRGRESPRWQHPHQHKKHSSKREHHYKKHLFNLDTTDMTSTTSRSLDLSSLLDVRSESSGSAGDSRAIRRQLRGLETMYAEVLQLLGVRTNAKPRDARFTSKRRYGSMSSLPSSSVSSRPRERRHEQRKKYDSKAVNKRFQRLESHVVTLARSVAHLSSEMRTQHLVIQEMDNIRAEIASLRHMVKSQQHSRAGAAHDPLSFSNPDRVKRLTKFFGDEPPLMRLFLKRLGYEKYASMLEKEKVGAAELPYVGEDKLRSLGVPLGPRMRILKEAGLHAEFHMARDQGNTTTTLAIV